MGAITQFPCCVADGSSAGRSRSSISCMPPIGPAGSLGLAEGASTRLGPEGHAVAVDCCATASAGAITPALEIMIATSSLNHTDVSVVALLHVEARRGRTPCRRRRLRRSLLLRRREQGGAAEQRCADRASERAEHL